MAKDSGQGIEKLRELIKGIKIAMLTTVDADGVLHSRPMGTQEVEGDDDLWFFTGMGTAKASEVRRDERVNLSYAAPDDNRYVSVSGTAHLVHDKAKAKELWNPILKAWFPKGLDDPDLVLLRVRVEEAEYWDVSSSTMVQLVGLVKAVVTGKPYTAGPGEHQKLDLPGPHRGGL